jgi:hypothetical protein
MKTLPNIPAIVMSASGNNGSNNGRNNDNDVILDEDSLLSESE